MFEQAVLASQALRQATSPARCELIPALSGCPACRRPRLIAVPMLGPCDHCGLPLAVVDRVRPAELTAAPERAG